MLKLIPVYGQILDIFSILISFLTIFIMAPRLRTKYNILIAAIAIVPFSFIDLMYNIASDFLLVILYFFAFQFNGTKRTRRVLIYLSAFTITMVSENFSGLLAMRLINITGNGSVYNFIKFAAIYVSIAVLLTVTVTALGRYIKKKLSYKINFNEIIIEQSLLLGIGILAVGFGAITFISRMLRVQTTLLVVNLIIAVVLFLFIMLGLSFYISVALKKISADRDLDKVRNTEIYVKELESNYRELQKFKHDYKNILLSLSATAQDEKSTDVKQAIHEILQNVTEQIPIDNSFSGLYMIKDSLIRGILMTKLLDAKHKGIQVTLEIEEEISSMGSLKIVITRILGILLDNAIEASIVNDVPRITLAVLKNTFDYEFIIQNNIGSDADLNVDKFLLPGYTTKQKHSGLGLATVNDLTEEYDNLFFLAKVANDTFTVILTIEEERIH